MNHFGSSILELFAPLSGPLVPLNQVPDPVFSQKMVGDGMAIDPTDQILRAPCAGEIVQLHSSHHAVTIRTSQGIEVLLHIGLETVQLKGQGFTAKIKVGDQVRVGQELIHFDADFIALHAKSLITIMVLAGGPKTQLTFSNLKIAKVQTDKLFEARCDLENSGSHREKNLETALFSEPLKVHLPTGLHARPAAMITKIAQTFSSEIAVVKNSKSANAKSVVALLGLEILNGESIQFRATGVDAQNAIEQLTKFFINFKETAHASPQPNTSPLPHPAKLNANIISGVAASPGIVFGHIHQLKTQKITVHENSTDSSLEKLNLKTALAQANQDLACLQQQLIKEGNSAEAAVFAAHQELLKDPELLELSEDYIQKNKTAAFAWQQSFLMHVDLLAKLKNELLAQRANDLRDVGQRVLILLTHDDSKANFSNDVGANSILVCEDLSPSDIVKFSKGQILGFCTTSGGPTSHVSILAKSFGLPAVTGIHPQALSLKNGTEVILDGNNGELRLAPTFDEKQIILAKQKALALQKQSSMLHANEAAKTKDGHPISVMANIGGVADAKMAVDLGCDGVGLLRSEFLFLDRSLAPTEDEQFQVYQEIATILDGRPFTIRTLDVGGDKPLRYLPMPPEENPFLGERGIRIGLNHPEMLREQLRAILRVESKGEIHIMFPMISMVEEFIQVKSIFEEERAHFKNKNIKVGIMIEVPSAALLADELAKHADFFSIGTNDLSQYTLAIDRGHKTLAKYVDGLHPSVLKLIEMTVQAAHKHQKWVGVCGGIAGDPQAVAILIGLGIDELSVSLPTIPLVKAQTRELKLTDCQNTSKKALACSNVKDVRRLHDFQERDRE
jgi:phosphoenolpyruvate-protein phosphotransferase